MHALVIDTSTERGIVAILENNIPLFHTDLPFGLQNSQYILPALHKNMHEMSLAWKNLDYIVVATGPGSYTGIRVGAMIAKMISFSLNLPLIGVSTLAGFVPKFSGTYFVLIDAKISGVYMQKGEYRNNEIHRLTEPCVLPLAEAALVLADCQLLISPNFSLLKSKLEKFLPNSAHINWMECAPSSIQLDRIAQQKFEKKEFSLDGQLELLYMRKTQAEIEKHKT